MIVLESHPLHVFSNNFIPLMIVQFISRRQSKRIVPSGFFNFGVLLPEMNEFFYQFVHTPPSHVSANQTAIGRVFRSTTLTIGKH